MTQPTNLELLALLRASTFTDDEDETYRLDFQPALTPAEIASLAQHFPAGQLALELRELLAVTQGWEADYGPEEICFNALDEFGFAELLPHSLMLGGDGFGNFWVLDIDPQGQPGRVFFACHDPAVLVIHSQSLNEFLRHLLEFYRHPENNHLDRIHSETTMALWKQNRYSAAKDDFIKINPDYQAFMAAFEGPGWVVADLRAGTNGAGFAWGRQGPDPLIQRHLTELLWVLRNRRFSLC